jgi:hypothetical protein
VENVHPGDYYACFVMGRNHAGWGRELIRDAVHYIERLGMTHRDSVRASGATNEIRPNAAPRRPSPGRELL